MKTLITLIIVFVMSATAAFSDTYSSQRPVHYAVVHLYLAHYQVYPWPLEVGDRFTVHMTNPNVYAEHVYAAGESYTTILIDLTEQLQDSLPNFFITFDPGTLIILIQGRANYRLDGTYFRDHSQQLEIIQ